MLTNLAYGQAVLTDTSLLLPHAEVVGFNTKKDDLGVPKGLTQLAWGLQPLSEISYKTYGAGGVGSLSYRGLPANQIPVLWNGLNLSSPLLGQADVNQIPITGAWNAALERNGAGTPVAAGLAPAALNLVNRTILSDTLTKELGVMVQTSVGTYGLFAQEGLVEAKNSGISGSARIYHQQAVNNFSIVRQDGDDPTLPSKQHNAITENTQAEAQLNLISTGHYKAYMGYLYNKADRQLPPPITKYQSQERLFSQLHAASLRQSYSLSRSWDYTNTLGLVHELSTYVFENGIDRSPYGAANAQLTGKLSYTDQSNLQRLELQHYHQWARPVVGNYPSHTVWQLHQIKTNYLYTHRGWQAVPQVSSFWFRQKTYLLAGFSIGHGKRLQAYSWQTSLSTQPLFRAPTLNDLYYPVVGNPSLPVERGRSYEAKLLVNGHRAAISWLASLTAFVYRYSSFVVWRPEGNLWYPQGRQQARTSGITAFVSARYKLNSSLYLTVKQNVTYAQGGFGGPQIALQQRPELFLYTPALRSISSARAEYRLFGLEYQWNYTGRRWLDSQGQTPPLAAFGLHTLLADYTLSTRRSGTFTIGAQATVGIPCGYAYIANYAAPQYWGQFTISYQIGHGK